jgi:hypothetical protein
MTNVAEMRTIKPSGAYSDIKVGGMEDKKTGLGKSVGISFTPLNGDTAVTYNYMENPTNPLDVSRRTYQASPEATDQLKSGTGDLGSLSFGKQFNKAVRRMAGGLSAMSNDRFDQDGFLII